MSATPYALLTRNSRILSHNIVNWEREDVSTDYVGIDDLVQRSHGAKWEGCCAPLRVDQEFENFFASEKEASSSEIILVAYLHSICKYFESLGVSKEEKEARWVQAVGGVAKFHRLGPLFERYSRFRSSKSEDETDGIVKSLIGGGKMAPLVFVRIASGKAHDARFLASCIGRLLKELSFDYVFVAADLSGDTIGETVANTPGWMDALQAGYSCQTPGCACQSFAVAAVGHECATCDHVHFVAKTYGGLKGIPAIVIVVNKLRFGDTMPDNVVLDLRGVMRGESVSSLSCLVQQIGRLCFYKALDESSRIRFALLSDSLVKCLQPCITDNQFDLARVRADCWDPYVIGPPTAPYSEAAASTKSMDFWFRRRAGPRQDPLTCSLSGWENWGIFAALVTSS